MGRRLRGLTLHQVQELLRTSYKGVTEIDLVICRANINKIKKSNSPTPSSSSSSSTLIKDKPRKISLDSYMKVMGNEEKCDDFTSCAIKYEICLFI